MTSAHSRCRSPAAQYRAVATYALRTKERTREGPNRTIKSQCETLAGAHEFSDSIPCPASSAFSAYSAPARDGVVRNPTFSRVPQRRILASGTASAMDALLSRGLRFSNAHVAFPRVREGCHNRGQPPDAV